MKPTLVQDIRNPDGSGGNVEVFLHDLDADVEDFIRDMDEDQASKPATFLGILKSIYVKRFRPRKPQQYNMKSVITEPEEIEMVWDWYTQLAYKFGRTPTVCQFGVLTGIDRHTFQDWRDGSTRNARPEYSTFSKKMFAEAEAALEAKAYESNSVTSIFGLKAFHQWRETSPVLPTETQTIQHDSAEVIAERHRGAVLPEKPDFD